MSKVDCPECAGEGQCTYEKFVPMGFSRDYGEWEDYVTQCDNCRGCGKIDVDE